MNHTLTFLVVLIHSAKAFFILTEVIEGLDSADTFMVVPIHSADTFMVVPVHSEAILWIFILYEI